MIKVPLEDIISKIKEKTQLSEDEINSKIDAKLKELSGLISKEGAAHIIANELDVKVFDQTSGKLEIKNILTGMRNVEAVGKVIRCFELREFKTDTREGKVASMIIADESGSIRITMWGEQAHTVQKLKEGDIVKIEGGYVRENQGKQEVHLNERSSVIINPEGVKLDNVSESPSSQRKKIKDLSENDSNAEILGTIVQVFDPRFFEVHPETGRRIRPNEEQKFIDDNGNEVNPDYSYVINSIIDDGTETIRCTFFKNQAEHLLSMSKEEILSGREDQSKIEQMKNSILGNIVKIAGRVNKNDMFDRVEFVAQIVQKPDPEKEIENL